MKPAQVGQEETDHTGDSGAAAPALCDEPASLHVYTDFMQAELKPRLSLSDRRIAGCLPRTGVFRAYREKELW